MGPAVDLTETLAVFWPFCVLLAKGLKADVMHFADETAVPATEITHVAVYEEIVGLHIVRPAVQLVITPAEPLAMNDEAADKKLLHGACVQVLHTVKLHVTLEYGAHGLA